MPPPKSNVWIYFEKVGPTSAKCKICFQTFKTSGNTSNLAKHLQSKHSNIINKSEKVKASHRWWSSFFKNNKCLDNRPINIVEGVGFKRLIKELAPLYKVPSRETFKKLMDTKYEVIANLYKTKFSEISHFSVTCDVWSEMMSCRSFLGVTVHFIEDRKLTSVSIDLSELSERHTSDYISTQLLEILNRWNIDLEKVEAVVTDGGTNMLKAISDSFLKIKHVPCFAHLVNLVVEHSLENEETKSLLNKVRSIVKWAKNSVIVSDELRKRQLNKGTASGNLKKLILDVSTRWNSVFYMLERFVELSSLVSEILLSKPHAPAMLTAVEILQVKEVICLLRPLEYITREASGEEYITISKIIPMLACVSNQLDMINLDLPLADNLKSKIKTELKKRFSKIEYNHAIAVATLLDPRFKNLHFQEPLAASKVVSYLREQLKQEYREISSGSDSESNSQDSSFDFWNYHKKLAHSSGSTKRRRLENDHLQDELSIYLANPVANLKSNPLEQWEEMKTLFPLLYKQAMNYGPNHRPDVRVICKIVEKFEREFTLHDTKLPTRRRNARTQDNIAAVRASVVENANVSVNRRSQELGLTRMTTWRILRRFRPTALQDCSTQELKPLDRHKRRLFADWALDKLENDGDFLKK
ncbi:unnamed protein product [Diabrotica balteata]|uniref:BED-type domain-containing protein n=1 Tax=Diabrotica balteata TaxID=107213 RepID=A0A9N9SSB0_DIABA|nr:unnamed protein product [Diabrotica balteata]